MHIDFITFSLNWDIFSGAVWYRRLMINITRCYLILRTSQNAGNKGHKLCPTSRNTFAGVKHKYSCLNPAKVLWSIGLVVNVYYQLIKRKLSVVLLKVRAYHFTSILAATEAEKDVIGLLFRSCFSISLPYIVTAHKGPIITEIQLLERELIFLSPVWIAFLEVLKRWHNFLDSRSILVKIEGVEVNMLPCWVLNIGLRRVQFTRLNPLCFQHGAIGPYPIITVKSLSSLIIVQKERRSWF